MGRHLDDARTLYDESVRELERWEQTNDQVLLRDAAEKAWGAITQRPTSCWTLMAAGYCRAPTPVATSFTPLTDSGSRSPDLVGGPYLSSASEVPPRSWRLSRSSRCPIEFARVSRALARVTSVGSLP